MARRTPSPAGDASSPLRLTVSRTRAEEVIDRHIGEGRTLQADSEQVVTEEHYDEWTNRRKRWVNLTAEALRSIYSSAEPKEEFEDSSRTIFGFVVVGETTVAEEFDRAKEAVDRATNTLLSLRERLEYLEAPDEAAAAEKASSRPRGEEQVFLVHGHSGEAKESVGRLLEKTGSHQVVILHEQPSEGRTLIEKFEDHAKSSDHAVVLLTADDVGGAAPAAKKADLRPRARQNVVFELGFFVGRLGRARVTVLYEDGVELPSDFKGVVYIPLADESWRFRLLKELRSAGLTYDLNKIPT
jgi:predicted nucleotide-binding protein